uniref:Uncharacterized protein n=1 Tax=Setaria viridis TaxID=4556 RepID=A0A4U6V3Y4_SETVI|nr:hypothetical protein SEVIR_4G266600v2 [Setaria viridis]
MPWIKEIQCKLNPVELGWGLCELSTLCPGNNMRHGCTVTANFVGFGLVLYRSQYLPYRTDEQVRTLRKDLIILLMLTDIFIMRIQFACHRM